jgi:antirestriction protein
MELPEPGGAGPETTGNQEHEQEEEHEALREEGPRIYVASLSDYNNGVLHGAWIDAAQESDQLQEEVDAMLARSPSGHAEEFAVHDYEFFGQYAVDEYDSLDWLSRIARGIAEHGLAFAAWVAHCGHDEEALNRFEDTYLGEWQSIDAYAQDLIDDLGWQDELDKHLPQGLQAYITVDVEGFARDLELGGDITTVEHADGVWIFDGTT